MPPRTVPAPNVGDAFQCYSEIEMPPTHETEGTVMDSAILLPSEHLDIRLDVSELLTNAEEWLATPNSNFGGRRPSELIGTPDETLLRETLRSAIYSGMA
jgi:hypothetical protein